MSGLRKRMQRKLLTAIAREHRKKTAGYGKYRRPIQSWVQTTKFDLAYTLITENLKRSREAAPTDPNGSEPGA